MNSSRTIPIEWNGTLDRMARYDIYRINSFRILSLPITASHKDISSRTRKALMTATGFLRAKLEAASNKLSTVNAWPVESNSALFATSRNATG